MKSNIDKYKAINKLTQLMLQITELRELNYGNENFKKWKTEFHNLIEDLFDRESRHFKAFRKIKFTPGLIFLGDPENERKHQTAYEKGFVNAETYLKNLIAEMKELWNVSNEYDNILAIQPNKQDEDFIKLAKSIRDKIEENQPEIALDHLHTYLVKYLRELNNKHDIDYKKETPLHSLFGGYIKTLNEKKMLESKMSKTIMKYSISILDEYNDIRNNKSFAHDNSLLNYNEAKLIFNNISNLIQFINSIENN